MSSWYADDLMFQDHTQYLKILQRITIDSPQQTEMQSKIIDAEQEEGLLEDSIDDDDDDEVSQLSDLIEDFAHYSRQSFPNIDQPYILSQ